MKLFAVIALIVIAGLFVALHARTYFDRVDSLSSAAASASVETAPDDDKPIGCHTPAPAAATAPTESATSASTATAVIAEGMELIRAGRFLMGAADGLPVEAPVHELSVKDFLIDRHAVTVAEFGEFVRATAYTTEAEKLGWSGAFDMQAGSWKRVDGADWRHPDGPASSASSREPVTQVSWNDASAYAKWAKKRLPTEAEFEYAARGGLAGKRYSWGDELTRDGKYQANWWQGRFPDRNLGSDGFIGRAPVGSFPANGYGLYDMTGNVWEWCADWFAEDYYRVSPAADPRGPSSGGHRVIRGGSWLCSENYCTGYRVAARNHTAPDTGLNNLGFRCVKDR